MAKNNNTVATTTTVKAKRPQSAAQAAKKAANIAAYQRRCDALRARQDTLNGVRKATGKALSDEAAIVVLDQLDRQRETVLARSAVVVHMNHPEYGVRLTKFLGNRPGADPCRLMMVIRNWLQAQGLQPAA